MFCAAIRRHSIAFLKFHFLSHEQVFSYEISLFCRLKYPYKRFSFNFCFIFIVDLLIFVLPWLFLVAVISLSLHFSCILFRLLSLTFIVCQYHLSDVRPYASSLVFLSSGQVFRLSPSLVHFSYSHKYITRDKAQKFTTLMRSLLMSMVSWSFLVLIEIFFLYFSFIFACLMVTYFIILVSYFFSNVLILSCLGSSILSVTCFFRIS